MTARKRDELQSVAMIYRRNGAWFVSGSLNVPGLESATDDERNDCAGSLRRAKEVAIEMVQGCDVELPANGRWRTSDDVIELWGWLPEWERPEVYDDPREFSSE